MPKNKVFSLFLVTIPNLYICSYKHFILAGVTIKLGDILHLQGCVTENLILNGQPIKQLFLTFLAKTFKKVKTHSTNFI